MNGTFGSLDPVTTYRLIKQEQDRRLHHTLPSDVAGGLGRGTGRRSVARGLRRVADLLDD